MRKFIIVILLFSGVQLLFSAKKNKEVFTIYLVRHAEKDFSSGDYTDPPLTICGEKRAEDLNHFLRDVDLDVIFSTDYNRTKNTAKPTATAKDIDINIYEDFELEELSNFLINCRKDALVVGHSYTTGVLAGLLVGEELGAFDLDIYNRIYKVVFYKNKGRIHLLNKSFSCEE